MWIESVDQHNADLVGAVPGGDLKPSALEFRSGKAFDAVCA